MFTTSISVLVCGLAVLTCEMAATAEEKAEVPVEVQTLSKATIFAFGGVGFAGSISAGEKQYRKVMEMPQPLPWLRLIAVSGTPEAKLYALCGIHTLDKGAFEAHVALLKKANPTVNTMSGCCMEHMKAAMVIQLISTGLYDDAPAKK